MIQNPHAISEKAWTECGEAYYAAQGNLQYLRSVAALLRGIGEREAFSPLAILGQKIERLVDDTLEHIYSVQKYHGWDFYTGERNSRGFGALPENVLGPIGKLNSLVEFLHSGPGWKREAA